MDWFCSIIMRRTSARPGKDFIRKSGRGQGRAQPPPSFPSLNLDHCPPLPASFSRRSARRRRSQKAASEGEVGSRWVHQALTEVPALSHHLLRHAGRVTGGGGEGNKMKSCSVPFPQVMCTSDPPRLRGGSAARTPTPHLLRRAPGGGLAARGVITQEPRDHTCCFILPIGSRKWKCQIGREGMKVVGAMAPLCPKHLINCLFRIFPAWFT